VCVCVCVCVCISPSGDEVEGVGQRREQRDDEIVDELVLSISIPLYPFVYM